MIIKPFSKLSEQSTIYDWLKLRELNVGMSEDLPQFGLIAYDKGIPVAAGFLRSCEGNYAIFDSLVTNPSLDASLRDYALDKLVSKLIKIAKHWKLKGIIAYSQDTNTLMRANRHGFKQLPHSMIALNLSNTLGAN